MEFETPLLALPTKTTPSDGFPTHHVLKDGEYINTMFELARQHGLVITEYQPDKDGIIFHQEYDLLLRTPVRPEWNQSELTRVITVFHASQESHNSFMNKVGKHHRDAF